MARLIPAALAREGRAILQGQAVNFPSRFVLKRAVIVTLVVATMSISISTGIRIVAGVKSDNITILVRAILPFMIGFPISLVLFSWLESLETAHARLLKEVQDLSRQANTDPLTGLLNRRSFEAQFDCALSNGSGGSFILADVDLLKQINDHYGHLTGDDAIIATASALTRVIGNGCLIARIGGDEFCAFVPHPDVSNAKKLASEINEIAAREFRARSGVEDIPLSISVSAQQCQAGTSFREILGRTDSELYRKKVRRPAVIQAVPEPANQGLKDEPGPLADASLPETRSRSPLTE